MEGIPTDAGVAASDPFLPIIDTYCGLTGQSGLVNKLGLALLIIGGLVGVRSLLARLSFWVYAPPDKPQSLADDVERPWANGGLIVAVALVLLGIAVLVAGG